MLRLLLAVVAVFVILAGCTGSQGYEAVRSTGEAKAECERELTVAAQRACEKQYEIDYEEYLEQRRKALSRDTEGSAEAG
jgi:plasmid replication initiation protein